MDGLEDVSQWYMAFAIQIGFRLQYISRVFQTKSVFQQLRHALTAKLLNRPVATHSRAGWSCGATVRDVE